jgi:hypothetical protein
MKSRPIFLFSLPRSGSTLLQHVLAAHPQISTVAESQLLLPFFYTLRQRGIYSEFQHRYVYRGIKNFREQLPGGTDDYLQAMRKFILELYELQTEAGAHFFLDKSGDYSLIVDEIMDLFPNAKFIFLWRNPLSVISSLMESWRGGRWNIFEHELVLYEGLPKLIQTFEKKKAQAISVRFEDLVADPDVELARLFDYLELEHVPQVVTQFTEVKLTGDLGDQPGLRRYQRISRSPVNKWKRILANPLRKRWCRRYLNVIGHKNFDVMGYDLDVILRELNALPPQISYLGSDLVRMPYGVVFRLLEGRILREKIEDLLAGRHIYLHH